MILRLILGSNVVQTKGSSILLADVILMLLAEFYFLIEVNNKRLWMSLTQVVLLTQILENVFWYIGNLSTGQSMFKVF